MDWMTAFQEMWWQFLLAALVFLLFGIGTVWMGASLGGTRFLLTWKGEKTTGQISRVEWDSYSKKYNCFICYTLANGKKQEERIMPITFNRGAMKKKIGTEYDVYYNPDKPKQFFCPKFFTANLFGLLCMAIGIALIIGALVVCGMATVALLAA